MCVLIVDDDAALRESVLDIVVDAGYAARAAADGSQALAMLAEMEPPCLLITDVQMPVMDGIELAARVREDPRMADVNIVFMTACHERVPVGWNVLAKPMTIEDLEETLTWARPCRR
jgi:CheY-like chemotaxis protein